MRTNCGAFAEQKWIKHIFTFNRTDYRFKLNQINISLCIACKEYSIWKEWYEYDDEIAFPKNRMIYPDKSNIPNPNIDLSKEIQEDYNESRSIANKSPRGAAALLRLCIQKLCKQLGEKGKDLNFDIGNLVLWLISSVTYFFIVKLLDFHFHHM